MAEDCWLSSGELGVELLLYLFSLENSGLMVLRRRRLDFRDTRHIRFPTTLRS